MVMVLGLVCFGLLVVKGFLMLSSIMKDNGECIVMVQY